jgi:hypothetical protein
MRQARESRVKSNLCRHASCAAEWCKPQNAAGRKMMMISFAAGIAGRKRRAAAAAISGFQID